MSLRYSLQIARNFPLDGEKRIFRVVIIIFYG